MPQRIQRKRTAGWRMPEGAVYVGRPTKWGNPFAVVPEPNHPRWAGPRHSLVQDVSGRFWDLPDQPSVIVGLARAAESSRMAAARHAVELFELHIGPMGNFEYDDDKLAELRSLAGRDFACWCVEGHPCHADVLLELANGGSS